MVGGAVRARCRTQRLGDSQLLDQPLCRFYQHGPWLNARIAVSECSIFSCDMVYMHTYPVRQTLHIENSHLEGCIRPYSTFAQSNQQTSLMLRFCLLIEDYIGIVSGNEHGISTYFTGEPNANRLSDVAIPGANSPTRGTIDPINQARIQVETGSTATAYALWMPRIIQTAWLNGLRGKTLTITHLSGTDTLTLNFVAEGVAYAGAPAAPGINLVEIGDSVTLALESGASGWRWVIVGSYGI